MAGMVLGIHFPDPRRIALVPNIKFQTEAIKYLQNHRGKFKKEVSLVDLNKEVGELQNRRRVSPHMIYIPPKIWHWVRARWQEENINPKHDHYGLPAGKIDQIWIDQYPNDYFDYAMAAEFVEETERIIVRSITKSDGEIVRVSLFKRLMLLLSKNRETGDFDYEHYFFHIEEADGNWATKGFPEETGPPEIVPITSLFPPNYKNTEGQWPEGGIDLYPKHGFGVKFCLRELVREGKTEYQPALEHIEKFFPREAKDVGLIQELEAKPTLNLSDEELWRHFTQGQGIKKIGSR